MKDIKIGLVQMESRLGQRKDNLTKIESYIEKAWENKVDIICFPEAAIDGYSKGNLIKDDIKDIDLYNRFQRIAVDYSITILVGLIESNPGGRPYISHIITTPDGNIAYYKKTHLGIEERKYFSMGEKIPIFKTPKANIGIQLCWETHFPEISRIMALKGADIIFTPFASPMEAESRRENWLKYLPARAYDNTVFVAACNSLSSDGITSTSGGGLLALDPKGNPIGEDFSEKEGILFVELDSELIHNIRSNNGYGMKFRYYMDNRRPELYGRISE